MPLEVKEERKVLLRELHQKFIVQWSEGLAGRYEYAVTEHLRLSGMYWGLTALSLLDGLHLIDEEKVTSAVLKCERESGGFSAAEGHDPSILYTLSAIQILSLYRKVHLVNAEKVARFVASLQNPDGSFMGDCYGEVDTRFSYCAIWLLKILNKMEYINLEKAVEFVRKCQNFDGGFGAIPGGESHSGQIFTAVGALKMVNRLKDSVDVDKLGHWLAERQTSSGGLNGRPEKLPDVCYSWWVLASLTMLDRVHWIDQGALQNFILEAQDERRGGISDRPDDETDVFHTFFGIAGLSLLGFGDIGRIDPVYALPEGVVADLLQNQQ